MASVQDLIKEFGTSNDDESECMYLLSELFKNYTWEEICDLYWEFREKYNLQFKNYAQVLTWIIAQKGRKAEKEHNYIGSTRNR